MKVKIFWRRNKIFHKPKRQKSKNKRVQRNQQDKLEVEGNKNKKYDVVTKIYK